MGKDLPVIYQTTAPANSSRYFSTFLDAVSQPAGALELAWDSESRCVRNLAFDESLISWDHVYCTSSVDLGLNAQISTFEYFEAVTALLGEKPRIVDIGCGQGEFVQALRNLGIEAWGFDPVLRAETEYLKARLWSTGEDVPADLFVMRCVLPHIVRWEEFLEDLFTRHPDSMVLIEFQSMEWMTKNGLWQQLSHDHVNIFTDSSFSRAFNVVSTGSFAEGEWNFALLRRGCSNPHDSAVPYGPERFSVQESFQALERLRREMVETVIDLGLKPVIWGAAGKGQVLAHALGREIGTVAVDADPAKNGKYLELSAVSVEGATSAPKILVEGSVVLVSNPRHSGQIVDFVGGRVPVLPVNADLPRRLKELR